MTSEDIIRRERAAKMLIATYQPVNPCPRGHMARRRVKDNGCRACLRMTPSALRRKARRLAKFGSACSE